MQRVLDVLMVIRGTEQFVFCKVEKFDLGLLLRLSTGCVASVAAVDIHLRRKLECGRVTVMELSCQTDVR